MHPQARTKLSALQTIIAHKRIEVAKARLNTPMDTLQRRVAEIDPPRNFFAAVVNARAGPRSQETRIIAGLKRRSPFAGIVREDFNPVAIAQAYEENGAAALACWTDETSYGGHLGYIAQVKSTVALPVLRQDFIVDEYQVWESRAAGADALVLIADVLPEGEMLDMMILARELRMTTLVSACTLDALLKVRPHAGFPHAGYSLLAINNRDPQTGTADLNHTLRLADMVEDRRVLVSEGGIRSAADLQRLRDVGVRIVIVSENLLRESDPGAALKRLTSMPGEE